MNGSGDPLLALYLARRAELLRYFRLRLRSAEAAEDLVQDIYLRIVSRPAGEITNPGAFLYRVGANLMLDRIKQERRIRRRATAWQTANVSGATGAEQASAEPQADDALASRQKLAQIIAALKELPEPAQRAFRLHKLEGLSHAETAEVMGVSRSSVEKYLIACLKQIASRVER